MSPKGQHMESVSVHANDTPLHLDTSAFKDNHRLENIRKDIIAAKLQRVPIILTLTDNLPDSFVNILPLCNLIKGTLAAFEQSSNLNGLEALNYFRQKTAATLVVYTQEHHYQIIDDECPLTLTFQTIALADKYKLNGQFSKTYYFMPRTLQISS